MWASYQDCFSAINPLPRSCEKRGICDAESQSCPLSHCASVPYACCQGCTTHELYSNLYLLLYVSEGEREQTAWKPALERSSNIIEKGLYSIATTFQMQNLVRTTQLVGISGMALDTHPACKCSHSVVILFTSPYWFWCMRWASLSMNLRSRRAGGMRHRQNFPTRSCAQQTSILLQLTWDMLFSLCGKLRKHCPEAMGVGILGSGGSTAVTFSKSETSFAIATVYQPSYWLPSQQGLSLFMVFCMINVALRFALWC